MRGKERLIKYFGDETYELPNKLGRKPFYSMAIVMVSNEAATKISGELEEFSMAEPLHATELLRTSRGREALIELIQKISSEVAGTVYLRPETYADKLGELSRKLILTQVVKDLAKEIREPSSLKIESRLSGYQSDTDLRTLGQLRRTVASDFNIDLSVTPKTSEPLLFVADALASSFRQKHVKQNRTYWSCWERVVEKEI